MNKIDENIDNYMDKLSISYMAKIFDQMKQNGWDGSSETADKYFDDIMRKIDPNFKENNPEAEVEDNKEPEIESKEIKTEAEDEDNFEEDEDDIEYQSDIELDHRKTNKFLKDRNIEKDEPEEEFEEDEYESKTIYDYLQDLIGEPISVGELNTTLQSLFAQFNTTFLTFGELYNKDDSEPQELVVWDDNDMYTITYNIIDLIDEPTIEITDIDLQ